ncbi:GDP-mannose 4,6-dehydratase [Yersinia enterocolitica]|uniref:GDP-mannose 4,6-dehydratase n=1 Tax=Yersinia enterocolitica TaxID=630 RepID=UPI0002E1CB43|nr:GDP-mannose 4,6-dehydratase [Yersinia enterocolitica]EKN6261976.1 NAD-dependent epimerase/dehydratase family protein [Yersinia enterocolitica]HEI6723979.1 GDP-mannose 4,6-dehydratase [Yersinia enterocolitica]HEI6759896.1 GDP-mannose 4,6-dehydratase [Yersinia enterocolitica]HEI6825902.1 GDP-mannose 4,6-dehydratase [Yersinia enterocolitica]HEI6867209.1 GDP-mannose 4,6-dehydratase [Yersinia enterocolitica]
MKLLITGGCGFLGSNLAAHAIKSGIDVIVFDNLSRYGSSDNLKWLQSIGTLTHVHGDIRNKNDVTRLIQQYKPNNIFHLAGQVAMTTSIDNPQIDFEINVGGTFNILEATRLFNPECGIIYSSTNKVYGDLEQFTYRETDTRYECIEKPNGFDEHIQLTFHSPYGCSKGAADQYMLDYARIYGLKTVVFRHSSMYGGRQFATYDQGWIGWFCQKAIDVSRGIKDPFTISGTGKQVRDVLHAEDIISLYFCALSNLDKIKGNAFNIGGTIDHSLSLLELFSLLEKFTETKLNYTKIPVRESDQKVFVADINKITKNIGWVPKVSSEHGIKVMLDWVKTV